MPLRKIKLYGKLGKLFGKEWNLDVNSVGEALRAINTNTNGKLEQYLYKGEGSKIQYKVCIKNKNNTISKEEINTPYQNGDIYIIPTIKGSGKNGVFQTIIGVVLIVVGVIFEQGWLVRMGVGLTLGGVAQMLMPNPKVEDTERRTSYLFQGNANTINQGAPVGTVYGRALVAPMPISISADNIDQNSYEGEIINIGAVGLINETLILYSSKNGLAQLCGENEYIDPSTPPKKYKTITTDGAFNTYWPLVEAIWTYWGSSYYDINCNPVFGIYSSFDNGEFYQEYGPNWQDYFATNVDIAYTKTTYTAVGNSPSAVGSQTVTLSNEDTELDAIARLLPTLSWSAWQSTPVYPYYYRNPSGFDISYQAVKTKTITLPGKYNPSFQYKYSAIIQRRIYGSSDPWVDAETISTTVSPQPDGTLILPELEIPNESGYESKITSPSINYA